MPVTASPRVVSVARPLKTSKVRTRYVAPVSPTVSRSAERSTGDGARGGLPPSSLPGFPGSGEFGSAPPSPASGPSPRATRLTQRLDVGEGPGIARGRRESSVRLHVHARRLARPEAVDYLDAGRQVVHGMPVRAAVDVEARLQLPAVGQRPRADPLIAGELSLADMYEPRPLDPEAEPGPGIDDPPPCGRFVQAVLELAVAPTVEEDAVPLDRDDVPDQDSHGAEARHVFPAQVRTPALDAPAVALVVLDRPLRVGHENRTPGLSRTGTEPVCDPRAGTNRLRRLPCLRPLRAGLLSDGPARPGDQTECRERREAPEPDRASHGANPMPPVGV